MRLRFDTHSLSKGYARLKYYITNFADYAMPDLLFRYSFRRSSSRIPKDEQDEIARRVNYYASLPDDAVIDIADSIEVGNFHYPRGQKHKFTTYFFDLYEVVRCFPDNFRFSYLFGDVNWDLPSATFAKARPIREGKSNTVLLPFNKVRHFRFVNDSTPFRQKKDLLIFRNVVRKQPWRSDFLQKFFDHPLCDVGQINTDTPDATYFKPFVPIDKMLDYKFIACIEGHDVATNLKWVMSSNSVAVMPRPKVESWFMEGTLVPDIHYIEVKPDYSDLIEKLEYYIAHPDKAEEIIENAHKYVAEFKNRKRERLIARLTAQRYFLLTGQIR